MKSLRIGSESDDYPDFAAKVARRVAAGAAANVLCGTGIGVSIAANKVAGDVVETWLDADFERGRHVRRIEKIGMLESSREENAREENK